MNKPALTTEPIQKAIIYARVSGVKQVREGDGLASQETRCREYAKYKNYEIIEVFRRPRRIWWFDRSSWYERYVVLS